MKKGDRVVVVGSGPSAGHTAVIIDKNWPCVGIHRVQYDDLTVPCSHCKQGAFPKVATVAERALEPARDRFRLGAE